MARSLRVNVAGGWYHVVSRGNGGDRIYRDDTDRRRFLGLVSELPGRFSVEIHAFVLMDNHYHLLLRCREANLSEAIRRMQVSDAGRRTGHRQALEGNDGELWGSGAGCTAGRGDAAPRVATVGSGAGSPGTILRCRGPGHPKILDALRRGPGVDVRRLRAAEAIVNKTDLTPWLAPAVSGKTLDSASSKQRLEKTTIAKNKSSPSVKPQR